MEVQVRSSSFQQALEHFVFRDLENATKSQGLNLEKETLLYKMEKYISQDEATFLG